MRLSRLAAVLITTALLAVACGGGGETENGAGTGTGTEAETGTRAEEDATITIEGEEANDHGSISVAGEDSTEFELDDFYFEPTVLKGKAGQRLTLEAFNEGDAPHTFTIDDQNVDEELAPDAEAEIEITFPDSGRVVFYCRFHRGQGMLGALEV